MTRIDWNRAATLALGVLAGGIATTGVLGVTAGGFALSFDAITAVAKAAHISPDIAWLMPVTIDGAMAVATVVAVILHRLGKDTFYPWCVVIAGTLVSIGCNAVHASMAGQLDLDPRVAMLVSAIPAVMLALSVHLLVQLVETVRDRVAPGNPADPEPPAAVPAPAPQPEPVGDGQAEPKPRRKAAAKKATAAGGKQPTAVSVMRAEYDRIRADGGLPQPADLQRAVREQFGKDPGGMAARYLAKWAAEGTDLDAEAAKLAQSGRTDG